MNVDFQWNPEKWTRGVEDTVDYHRCIPVDSFSSSYPKWTLTVRSFTPGVQLCHLSYRLIGQTASDCLRKWSSLETHHRNLHRPLSGWQQRLHSRCCRLRVRDMILSSLKTELNSILLVISKKNWGTNVGNKMREARMRLGNTDIPIKPAGGEGRGWRSRHLNPAVISSTKLTRGRDASRSQSYITWTLTVDRSQSYMTCTPLWTDHRATLQTHWQ